MTAIPDPAVIRDRVRSIVAVCPPGTPDCACESKVTAIADVLCDVLAPLAAEQAVTQRQRDAVGFHNALMQMEARQLKAERDRLAADLEAAYQRCELLCDELDVARAERDEAQRALGIWRLERSGPGLREAVRG